MKEKTYIYFSKLETRNFIIKQFQKVVKDDGTLVTKLTVKKTSSRKRA